jgi:hypothetical protein
MNRKKNAMMPMGPYCLHMAIKLICLACFRYLADSSRKLLEIFDIPAISLTTDKQLNKETEKCRKRREGQEAVIRGGGLTIQRIPTINQILDILRHNPRNILQLNIQPIQIRLRPRILINPFRRTDKRVKLDKRIGS